MGNINKKFIESFNVEDYEVMTDTGWEDIECTHKTIEYKVWILETSNSNLECADNHIVFTEGYNEVFVKDLSVGDKIHTVNGLECVTRVEETSRSENMYDLQLPVGTNHRYYTSDILSHNTTAYNVFAMWLVMFHPDKKILICANTAATALEFIGRLRLAYELIPNWLKPGITEWNKGRIAFSNDSSIEGCSTSPTSARGKSANCVDGTTIVTIRNIEDDEVRDVTMEQLYCLLLEDVDEDKIIVL